MDPIYDHTCSKNTCIMMESHIHVNIDSNLNTLISLIFSQYNADHYQLLYK